jgi:hypothetical protein
MARGEWAALPQTGEFPARRGSDRPQRTGYYGGKLDRFSLNIERSRVKARSFSFRHGAMEGKGSIVFVQTWSDRGQELIPRSFDI